MTDDDFMRRYARHRYRELRRSECAHRHRRFTCAHRHRRLRGSTAGEQASSERQRARCIVSRAHLSSFRDRAADARAVHANVAILGSRSSVTGVRLARSLVCACVLGKLPVRSALWRTPVLQHLHSDGTAAEPAGFGVVRNVDIDPPSTDGVTGIGNGVRSRIRSGVADANLRAERQDPGVGRYDTGMGTTSRSCAM